MLRRLRDLSGKLANHAGLLRRDPERFGRNVLQFTDPALFEQRLIDILPRPALRVQIDNAAPAGPRLNVLDTAWTRSGMTGGPNTAIHLALRVALQGIPTRLVATSSVPAIDAAWFRGHAASLLGEAAPDISIVSAADAAAPLVLGAGDIFLATHWTTAQQLKPVLPQLGVTQFFYMLQEFEAGFYAWSSNHALALETLGMDFWPVINQQLLADYLLSLPYGRLADPQTRRRAIVFEPAVDATLFHANRPPAPRQHCLLFYARPTNTRNMFGLGLLALRDIAADPAFRGWQFLSIGSRDGVPDLPLGHGHVLRRAPWMDYAGYGDLLRRADILLCPMLSPHTSYPVLEMSACGGLAVTNSFLTKTQAALASLSANIITTEPTISGFAAALRKAAARVTAGAPADGLHGLPSTWSAALDPAAKKIAHLCHTLAAH